MKYNADHGITPKQIVKDIKGTLPTANGEERAKPAAAGYQQPYFEPDGAAFAADPIVLKMTRPEIERTIANTKRLMEQAAKDLDFIQAAQYRDEIARLEAQLELRDSANKE